MKKTWQEKMNGKKTFPKILKLEKGFPCYNAVHKMGAEAGDESDGSLDDKYPGGSAAQKQMLEKEGFTIIQKGKKYSVSNYQQYLFKELKP